MPLKAAVNKGIKMSVIEETLKRTFGFETFKPGQRQVIEKITAGKSAASIFPTGAGKSLCYQLSAILEQGMTLVVSPLLSLMKNQIDFLKSKNIPAAKLDSGMSAQDYWETLEAARTGQLKILMIAVERFKNERFRTQLRQMPGFGRLEAWPYKSVEKWVGLNNM